MNSNYLVHHGVKGMKWGVRRYQNKDGTRTRLGKIHEKLQSPKAKAAAKNAAKGALIAAGAVGVVMAAKSPAARRGAKAAKDIAKQSGKQFVSGLPNTISRAGQDAVKVMLTGTMIYGFEKGLEKTFGPDAASKSVSYGRQPQKKK